MTFRDREHFQSYRRQTEVKHLIVQKYLKPFFHILRTTNKNLLYVDGFAGPGIYEDENGREYPGSPIRALEVIAEADELSGHVSSVFIEFDPVLYGELKSRLDEFYDRNSHIREPACENTSFSRGMHGFLDELDSSGDRLAPCFLFVDPCGVDGVDFSVIQRVMQHDSCEVFLFFNIDGVRRIVGLGDEAKSTLDTLLGLEQKKIDLIDAVAACNTPVEREECIISFVLESMKLDAGITYLTPFRIESEKKKQTSHYLIHGTKHPLGFKIMKDIMWRLGSTREGPGGLSLEQASIDGSDVLFRADWHGFRQETLDELRALGVTRVGYFYKDLVMNEDNRWAEPAYRQVLLELEEEGLVTVFEEDGVTPKPDRIIRKGVKTLAERLKVGASD